MRANPFGIMKADFLIVSIPYLSTITFNHPWIKQVSSKKREILPKCGPWGCSQTGDDADSCQIVDTMCSSSLI